MMGDHVMRGRVGRRTSQILVGSGGLSYRPSHWRPDKPGTVAIPEGPPGPLPDRPVGEPAATASEQRMKEATARNIAEREAALAPRRFQPKET